MTGIPYEIEQCAGCGLWKRSATRCGRCERAQRDEAYTRRLLRELGDRGPFRGR